MERKEEEQNGNKHREGRRYTHIYTRHTIIRGVHHYVYAVSNGRIGRHKYKRRTIIVPKRNKVNKHYCKERIFYQRKNDLK